MTAPSLDTNAQCIAARSTAAVFDLSDRPQLELVGPEAALFLHNLGTNDIKNLPAGRGCEFFLTTNKARVIAHGFAHRLLPAALQVLVLDMDPGSGAKVMAHLNHFLISEQVEIADRTAAVTQLHLCGPQAAEILNTVTPGLPPLEALQHVVVDGLRVVRHDRLGLAGFDLVCPSNAAAALKDHLMQAGAVPAGAEAFNVMRVEAGVPVDGIDIDANRFVVEIGRARQAISYTKGCYLGQEPIVMARDRGQVNRMLLGLVVEGPEPLPPGTKVMRQNQEIGQVTSSVWSPQMEAIIALAYIHRGSQEAGTGVEVGGRQAVVTLLPFTTRHAPAATPPHQPR